MTGHARLILIGLALGCAACGGGAGAGAFSWLADPAPEHWRVAEIPSGAAMIYPPRWRLTSGDPGTATAVLLRGAGNYLGYLNLTPRQGAESIANWASFRLDHNKEDGDHAVTVLAAASELRFRAGKGSCVEDDYTTTIDAHFREIACLVVGSRTASVIVGAAPPGLWPKMAPMIERAIADVRT